MIKVIWKEVAKMNINWRETRKRKTKKKKGGGGRKRDRKRERNNRHQGAISSRHFILKCWSQKILYACRGRVQRNGLRWVAAVEAVSIVAVVGLATAKASSTVPWAEALGRHCGLIPTSTSRSRAYLGTNISYEPTTWPKLTGSIPWAAIGPPGPLYWGKKVGPEAKAALSNWPVGGRSLPHCDN